MLALSGCAYAQTLYVACALELPDRLDASARAPSQLGVEADGEATGRLLRALACLGFAREEAGGFAQTEASASLRKDAPAHAAAMAIGRGWSEGAEARNSVGLESCAETDPAWVYLAAFEGARELIERVRSGRAPSALAARGALADAAEFLAAPLHWRAWGATRAAVESGRCAWEIAHGCGLFETLERPEHARLRATFDRIQDATPVEALAGRLEVGARVVDIGGGRGRLLRAVLERNPDAHGRVLERSSSAVTSSAREGRALGGRLRFVAGDAFVEVPAADTYLLRHVLHDFGDTQAVALLRAVHRCAPPGARIQVMERLLPPLGEGPSGLALLDLQMLVLTGGRERTETELRRLLLEAGWTPQDRWTSACGVDGLTGIRAEPRSSRR